jgi:hypothetical protein
VEGPCNTQHDRYGSHFHFHHAATADNFPASREGSRFGSLDSLLYVPFILVRAANANAAITLATDGAEEAHGMIIRNAQTQLVTTVLNKARPNFISKGNSKYSSFNYAHSRSIGP